MTPNEIMIECLNRKKASNARFNIDSYLPFAERYKPDITIREIGEAIGINNSLSIQRAALIIRLLKEKGYITHDDLIKKTGGRYLSTPAEMKVIYQILERKYGNG